jgi:hypothetical protein
VQKKDAIIHYFDAQLMEWKGKLTFIWLIVLITFESKWMVMNSRLKNVRWTRPVIFRFGKTLYGTPSLEVQFSNENEITTLNLDERRNFFRRSVY